MLRTTHGVALSVITLAWGLASPSFGAPVTFQIQPEASTLLLSGGAFWSGCNPLLFEAQPPSGLVASIGGELVVDLAPQQITFLDGVIEPATTGTYLPGALAGQYGFHADSGLFDTIGVMQGAFRGSQFTLTSGARLGNATADGFTFDVEGAQWTGLAGTIDFDGQPAGTLLGSLAGLSRDLANQVATAVDNGGQPASYRNVAGVETLTLPLHIEYENFESSEGITWILDGTLVATRAIPEPATMALFALGAFAALRCGRRQ